MDLDQSNASEALWRSGSIRNRGFGPGSVGLSCFFPVSWDCLLIAPVFLLPELLCVLIFLQKIPEKLPCASWCFLTALWHFYILKLIKYVCQNFLLICVFLCIFVKFLAWFFPIQCHMILILTIWFCDIFTMNIVIIITVLCIIMAISCVASDMNLFRL